MKKHSVGAKSFHADGQTDTMKLRATFHNFVNMPKKLGKITKSNILEQFMT